eukprot:GHVU01164233.1.p1 GENE.GHVU01164233.1~~GHVU01164233.1.p1  ORF type:complete len:382 (+),score=54.87 GHVU01164233.1:99-1148(+)
MGDVSLSTFCNAYSGEKTAMEREDFWEGKMQYYRRYAAAEMQAPPITLEMIAAQFVGETFRPRGDYPIDEFLYSNPSFWCKYMPTCPPGATCNEENTLVIAAANWTRGAWVGRKISTKPSWGMATGVAQFTNTRIRCKDKATVYKFLLETIFTDDKGEWVRDPTSGQEWSQEAVDSAAQEMKYSCMRSKGSLGYILSLGPLLSSITCLICMLSLCRWFQGPTTVSAAEGFAIVSIAMTLLGFWVVEFRVDNEFLQAYMFCGRDKALTDGPPYMVDKGVYFDGTPCVDLDTDGSKRMNPYVRTALNQTAVYTSGGICNLLATILLLVSVSKIKEKSKLSKFQTLEASDEL